MVLLGELAVGGADVLLGGVPRDAEDLVGILRHQCASAQERPMPVSATIGTVSAHAASITSRASAAVRVGFRLRHLEQQLVMHLQQQARGEPGLAQRGGQLHHGALDDVGGAPLQRRVDRGALGIGADGGLLVGDLRIQQRRPNGVRT